jgi:hypothetical protein
MGFVDPGDGHVHNIRNESTVEASTIAVQLIRQTRGIESMLKIRDTVRSDERPSERKIT